MLTSTLRAAAQSGVPPGASRIRAGLAVFGLAAVYLSLFAGVLQRIGDEGTLLNGAARVVDGAVPYRDFADLANPLSYYWLGGWFAVFGTHLATARLLLVLTGASSAALVFWLAARAYGARTGTTAAVLTTVLGIPFWPGTSHHWDSNLFFLATLACLALWHESHRSRFALLAGAAAAATSGFMINKGAVALLVALCVVWWSRKQVGCRALIGVLTGFGTVIGIVCVVFLLNGAWSDFVYINVVFPATRYEDTGRVPYGFYFLDVAWLRPLALLTGVVPQAVATVLAGVLAVPLATLTAIPLLAIGAVAAHAWLTHDSWRREQALLWGGGLALWLSEAHRWDLFHLMYGSPLLFAGIVGEAPRIGGSRAWGSRLVGALTVCTVGLGIWQGAIGLAAQVPQETRRGSVRTYAHDEALQFLLDQTKPGDYVFVYPYYPMYYFLADLRNPTRYGILLYGYNTVGQFKEALSDLDAKRPKYVLWDTLVDADNWKRWYPAYAPPSEQDVILEPYLATHYRTIARKSGFRIMERLEAPVRPQ